MYTIAIHGGAGTIAKTLMDTAQLEMYKAALQKALDAGYALLDQGNSALDAVMAAVVSLEDCPLFNAGKGAVFNHEGRHEMDAAIMDGDNRRAGAVAGVEQVKNPVILARTIMEHSAHVCLSGAGALAFAKKHQLDLMPDNYFFDQFRFDQYQEALKADRIQLDHSITGDKKFSTVGAVALDRKGNLAAATSTGGMTNKKYGRIGDTPIIGAGTYAHNQTCAVSCTGHGEYFMRQVAAHQVHCLMMYKGLTLEAASKQVVMAELTAVGGEGGLIGVDYTGNVSMPFNSEGMYRGFKKSDGSQLIAIHNQ